jgi:phosphatidylglycerophosphate synthase
LHQSTPLTASSDRDTALCLIGESSVRLWSRGTAERLTIQFARAGIVKTISEPQIAGHRGSLILLRADAVLDEPLIPILTKRRDLLLLGDGREGKVPVAAHVSAAAANGIAELLKGNKPAAQTHLHICSPSELGAAFWKQLRKRQVPYALIVDHANKDEIEWRTFMGTYKGATDIITKRLWPVPAFHVTRALASMSVTPNAVTALAAIFVVVAFFLFLNAHFAWGLVAAWLMTFLDTVDGKLARTTLTSSKSGDVFDHAVDLIHPPFWYVAWALGLAAAGFAWSTATFWWVIGIILGGYLVQRLMEGAAIKWLGMEIHIWRPIDTRFREITARRNPNLIILTLSVVIGRPDLGLIAVAAWTAVCLLLHAFQLVHAFVVKRRNGHLGSWMRDPASIK